MGIYSKLYALRDFQNDTSILSPDTLKLSSSLEIGKYREMRVCKSFSRLF